MAKLRAASAYRRIKRANTRTSRKKKKGFVRGVPTVRVVMFDVGGKKKWNEFPMQVDLVARKTLQIRDNALEAGRQTATRQMDFVAGKTNWYMKIKAVPHQIVREKPLASGAGADRFSQGMGHGHGKPYGHAAPVKPGKVIMSIYCHKDHVLGAKEALRKAQSKMPLRCQRIVKDSEFYQKA